MSLRAKCVNTSVVIYNTRSVLWVVSIAKQTPSAREGLNARNAFLAKWQFGKNKVFCLQLQEYEARNESKT